MQGIGDDLLDRATMLGIAVVTAAALSASAETIATVGATGPAASAELFAPPSSAAGASFDSGAAWAALSSRLLLALELSDELLEVSARSEASVEASGASIDTAASPPSSNAE